MTRTHQPPLTVATPDPATVVLHVGGSLDRVIAARLLRVIDARLVLVRTGESRTRRVLLDLTGVSEVSDGALAVLRHPRHTCPRHGVAFALVGVGHLAPSLSPRDRGEVARLSCFPNLDVALAALPADAPCTPVG